MHGLVYACLYIPEPSAAPPLLLLKKEREVVQSWNQQELILIRSASTPAGSCWKMMMM